MNQVADASFRLFVDITFSIRSKGNSTVLRLMCRFSRELQQAGFDPVFVVWQDDAKQYVLPTKREYEILSRFNGPNLKPETRISASAEHRTFLSFCLDEFSACDRWLLLPESFAEQSLASVLRYARERQFRTAAICFDATPVWARSAAGNPTSLNCQAQLFALAESDLVIPISRFAADCLRDLWRNTQAPVTSHIATILWPGEFGQRKARAITAGAKSVARMLCVLTPEAENNDYALLEACLRLAKNHPQLEWSLALASKDDGTPGLAERLQRISREEPRIQWVGAVDDLDLVRLYEESSFTVHPSEFAEFGLPILESIWHGRPCICHNQGIMLELAREGGCLTTDVTDPARLEEAIYQIGTDQELRARLSQEAAARPLKTWARYVAELIETLRTFSDKRSQTLLENALYSCCLLEQWQMNESERMALAGLLERHRPACSIEVGTFRGGSLSLIAQYSSFVFSIDIDETIAPRFYFSNVAFLTGHSGVILPQLFAELDRSGIAVDFILIDADHSREGVFKDITCLLKYVPKKPLVILLHDSFNPECRRGMLDARWETSPYCHAVDLDFVPGRLVEHDGPFQGQLWGGLALAYFLPYMRSKELEIRTSASETYERLAASEPATLAAASCGGAA